MTTNLLLVEDNTELAGSLGDYLSEVGFDVDYAFNGKSCLELIKANKYDVIVMDIMMPIKDGLTACSELRENYHIDTPLIFLTARDSLDDKLKGFSSGCDDYLVKPFAPEELVCRLNALRNRGKIKNLNQQTIGDLKIDHQLSHVYRKEVNIDLNNVEFKILAILAQYAPESVSSTRIEDMLWPDGTPGSDPLRIYIYRLRQKLDKPFKSSLIKSVHGKGYRLAVPN
ncbi:MAG: response regulator transcription factor [Pseudomonadota bacterium]